MSQKILNALNRPYVDSRDDPGMSPILQAIRQGQQVSPAAFGQAMAQQGQSSMGQAYEQAGRSGQAIYDGAAKVGRAIYDDPSRLITGPADAVRSSFTDYLAPAALRGAQDWTDAAAEIPGRFADDVTSGSFLPPVMAYNAAKQFADTPDDYQGRFEPFDERSARVGSSTGASPYVRLLNPALAAAHGNGVDVGGMAGGMLPYLNPWTAGATVASHGPNAMQKAEAGDGAGAFQEMALPAAAATPPGAILKALSAAPRVGAAVGLGALGGAAVADKAHAGEGGSWFGGGQSYEEFMAKENPTLPDQAEFIRRAEQERREASDYKAEIADTLDKKGNVIKRGRVGPRAEGMVALARERALEDYKTSVQEAPNKQAAANNKWKAIQHELNKRTYAQAHPYLDMAGFGIGTALSALGGRMAFTGTNRYGQKILDKLAKADEGSPEYMRLLRQSEGWQRSAPRLKYGGAAASALFPLEARSIGEAIYNRQLPEDAEGRTDDRSWGEWGTEAAGALLGGATGVIGGSKIRWGNPNPANELKSYRADGRTFDDMDKGAMLAGDSAKAYEAAQIAKRRRMGADTVTTIEGNVNAGNALESQQALIGQHAAAQQQQLVDEIARHRELARQLKSPSGGAGQQGGGNPPVTGPGSGPAQLPPPPPVPAQNPSVNLPAVTEGTKPPVGGGSKSVLVDDGAIDLPPQKVLPPPQTDPVPKTRPQKTQPPDEGVIADPPPVKKEKPSALPNPDADKYNGIAERAADQMALGQEVTEKTLTALAKADGVPMTPTRAKIMLDRLNRAKTSATQEGVAKADFGTHVRKTTKAGQHYAVPGSLLLAAIAGGSRRSDASEQDGPIMRALRGFGGQR